MASVKQLESELESAKLAESKSKARAVSLRAKMEEATREGVELTLMVGTAFLASAATEKYRHDDGTLPNIGGVPIDGGLGAILVLGAVLDVGGEASGYIGALGEGLIASFAARAGADMGKKSREKQQKKVSGNPAQLPAGQPGGGAYGPQQFQQFLASMGATAPTT